jgi:hypothetical protein
MPIDCPNGRILEFLVVKFIVNQVFPITTDQWPTASQVENASSILVARSKDIHLKLNDYKGSWLTSSDHR